MNKEDFIINIEDIESEQNKTVLFEFEEQISEINSKGPIKASLEIVSLGDYIQIQGEVTGSVMLECDLCLKEYEQEIDFEINELFVKNSMLDEYGSETELKDGQFVTDLYGSKDIDLYDLLYQSVILDLPNKKVCGINCNEGNFKLENDDEIDPRLAVFKDIKVNGKG
jgi:uncharacterized metal-binding protein YceD (DUF177 family)